MRVRVAAAQIALGKGSYERTMHAAVSLIDEASVEGALVVCLPEHWLLEYRERSLASLDELSQAAIRGHVYVVTGANYTETGIPGDVRVRSFLIQPDGQLVGYQDKVHLFRSEGEVATPGERYNVLTTPIGRIGISVCYDNVFPEVARTLVLNGSELLFVPSRIVSEGWEPWILYLKTRALENRVPIVASNIFHPPRYMGGSVIIDLQTEGPNGVVLPKVMASAGEGEKVIVADVDLGRASELRRERFTDRRPQAYEIR